LYVSLKAFATQGSVVESHELPVAAKALGPCGEARFSGLKAYESFSLNLELLNL